MIPRVSWFAVISFACACNPFKAEVPAVKAGVDAYEQSKFDDAANKFDESIREEPTSEAHFGRGATLRQQHKDAEAAEEFRRVLSTGDDELKARAYLNLGNAEARAGRMKEAIEAYARALQLSPSDADARYNLEWALREKQKPQGSKGDGDEKSDEGSDQGENGDKSDASKKDEKSEGKDEPKKDGDKDGSQQEQSPGAGKDGGDKKDGNQGPKPGPQDGASEPQAKGSGQSGEEKKAEGAKPQQGQEGAQPPEGGERQAQPAGAAKAAPPPKSKGRQDVGQVLDALQANEKGLQMWRFQKRDETKGGGDVDQDW